MLKKSQIASSKGSYVIGKENSLPNKFKSIGKKAISYRKNVSQNLYSKTKDQIKKLQDRKYLVSIKRDGMFSVFYYNKDLKNVKSFFINAPTLRVYYGLPINEKMESYLEKENITECLLCGELIASSETPPNFNERCRVYDFTSYSRSPNKSGHNLENIGFRIFDIIELNKKDLMEKNYFERFEILKDNFNGLKNSISIVETKKVNSPKEILKFYKQAVEEYWEGIVIRGESFGYKVKPIKSVDAVIIGFAKGMSDSRVKEDQVSSVLTALRYDDGKFQTLARVGGGLTDEQRTNLFRRLSNIKLQKGGGKGKAFFPTTNDGRSYYLVEPHIVIEINYMDLLEYSSGEIIKQNVLDYSKDGWEFITRKRFPKLIFPRIKKIRDDKTEKITDIRISQITKLIDYVPPQEIKVEKFKKGKVKFLLVLHKEWGGNRYIKKFMGIEHKNNTQFPYPFIYYIFFRDSKIDRDLHLVNKDDNFKKEFEKYVESQSLGGYEVFYGDNNCNRIKGTFDIEDLSFDKQKVKKYQIEETPTQSKRDTPLNEVNSLILRFFSLYNRNKINILYDDILYQDISSGEEKIEFIFDLIERSLEIYLQKS